MLGQWEDMPGGGSKPMSGLAYYVSPPQNIKDIVNDPFHAVFYLIFILSACALFSKVSFLSFTVTFNANLANNLTRSP